MKDTEHTHMPTKKNKHWQNDEENWNVNEVLRNTAIELKIMAKFEEPKNAHTHPWKKREGKVDDDDLQ